MFLQLLTPDQQALFVEAARAVIEQDGVVEETELALLDGVRAECGIEALPDVREIDALVSALAESFDDGPSRNVMVLELAGVAAIDGSAHPSEVELVRAIAEGVGISSERVAESFAFAARAQELVADGQALIASADGDR